ncbi:MAG TPA: threonine synthase [Nitrososphaerales archaeon]|nr:threonine synthase [Nitrososphaerales archaeon]
MSKSEAWKLVCISCGKVSETERPDSKCKHCGDLLEVSLSEKIDGKALFRRLGPGIWRFSAALPFDLEVNPVSLGEGGTPLVPLEYIGGSLGLENLYAKNDGQNPTGSFKDRGIAVAVTRARALGAKALVCASTGNTAASLAAYAAKAGIKAVVVVPKSGVASGKLGQAFAYGARVFGVEGSFDDALGLVLDLVKADHEFYLMNSLNPFRIEGQKVAAFEIYEQLGRVPDYLILPVGNAGNISAIWKGFKELRANGITSAYPKMIGVQAEGAAPLAKAFVLRNELEPVREPQTIASAIKIGNPVSWKKAIRAIEESGGTALTVSDDEIIQARDELGNREGLLVEAASAAPLAALRKLKLPRSSNVVCVATGNGLKDLADHRSRRAIETVDSPKSIIASLGYD